MDDWIDDDDDDDFLESLSNKPPRSANVSHATQDCCEIAKPQERDAESQLLKAQGEASMLRDRLKLFEAEKEQDRKSQLQKNADKSTQHQQEIDALRAELQRLEDEKKFLTLTGKSRLKNGGPSTTTATPDTSTASHDGNQSSNLAVKKRKLQESSRQLVSLKANRVISDEVSLFVQSVISHRLKDSEMTTLDILNHITLAEVRPFRFRDFEIASGDPVGHGVFELLLSRKRSGYKLDQFIDSLLENLAVLIKEISESTKECKTAVPFLVALMHHSITFRPSAVHASALKDLFHFMVDLVRTHRSVLKKPLNESPQHLDVEPNVFQYEFIRVLTVLYAFDTLEDSLKTLQSLSPQLQLAFIDDTFCEALDDLSRYSLTISYQPVLNVIYNTMEMLNCLANMFLELPQLAAKVPCKWWDNMKCRFYHVLNKTTSNNSQCEVDPGSLFIPDETNVYGLIRNMGDNYNGQFISQLVIRNESQSIPQVILKEFPATDGITEKSIDVEWWSLRLKKGIVHLFGKLAIIYKGEPVEKNMIKILARLMAQTQEVLLTVLLGQDSENIHLYYELFSELLKLIFQVWQAKECDLGLIREVECELVVCLWRVVFGTTTEEGANKVEMKEHKTLVDRFDELRIQSDMELFEDAFDNEPSDFILQEVESQSLERCREIMGIGVEDILKEMAKKMLEGITSMEDADALYLAMRGSDEEMTADV
ncbi:LANO_0G01772g1_1 [Lachancea nothofagi CBS 11611]|uniref:LANO_0G01772g1_1 n=1 Tax=Lachancea nothofagi CBS 11611 TaxID=1266666 RepID=A0A1G4KEQ4_9SACH|nr:LANO_0G01772g1_1 [Lachancea nothofagi CBS 11611]